MGGTHESKAVVRPRHPSGTLVQIVSYGIGLISVLALEGLPDGVRLLGGVAATLIGYVFLHALLFRRWPTLGMRPWRYSIPNAIGLFVALVLSTGQRLDASSTFATALPLIIVGNALSELWWSVATPAHAVRS